MVTAFAVFVLATAFFDSSPAYADLRLCNRTQNRVGVSIGYKDKKVWMTEGWWNVPMNSCETLVSGTLVSRYYYIYAVDYDHGGEWSGKYAMCTKDKMFTIQGTEDCVARGFNRSGFFEVDTGEQSTWTIQLNEPTQQGAKNQ
ncbi:putative membrane protein [Kaistia hirudinis]|uniref:Putative membrane protein n=1 Tax=Kaistia hirudinis TaxID=1293440 RepID=A0A840AR99_9HYPH|nr:putative membrane protein [Kaistia hirudinis]